MAKTQADQIKELTAALAELDARLRVVTERVDSLQKEVLRCSQRDDEFVAKSATAEERVTQLRAEVTVLREELRRVSERLAASEAKNAALEERARNQEKTSDRGFNFAQAAIISVISMIGGALLSLLAQLAIKK